MPEAIICASVKIGAPARSASRAAATSRGWKAEVAGQADVAAGVDHPDRDHLALGGQPDRSASARMVANDRR